MHKNTILSALVAVSLSGSPAVTLAQTWTGGGGTTAWNLPANWDTLPATDGSAAIILTAPGSNPTNQNLGNPLSIQSLSYTGTSASTLTVSSGNALTVGAGGISNADTSLRFNIALNASATQSWTTGGNIQANGGVSVAAGQTVALTNGPSTNDYFFSGTGGSGTGVIQFGANSGTVVNNLAAFGSASLAAATGGTGATIMNLGQATSGTLSNNISIGTRTTAGDSFRIRISNTSSGGSSFTLSGDISGDLAVVAPNLGNSRGLMLDGGSNVKADMILSGDNSGLTGSGDALNELLVANGLAVIAANGHALGNQTANTPSITLGNNDGSTTTFDAALLVDAAATFNNRISIDDKTTGVVTVGGIHTAGVATYTGNIAPARLVGGTTPGSSNQLNLFQAAGGQTTFTGVIQDSPAVSPDNRALAVTKDNLSNTTVGAMNRANDGIVSLTGANLYTGGTTIHVGTLLVNNLSGSATGTGSVMIASGATLGGAGSISGATTIAGSLRPGNSIGTLTVANHVTWDGNDPWVFELGTAADSLALAASGSSTQDLLNITSGNFVKGSGSTWVFDFASTGSEGWYQVVNWTGSTTFVADNFDAINVMDGFTATFTVDDATSALYVNVVAVPEPSMWGLIGLSVLALVLARRRAGRYAGIQS